jgi:glycosyltransferase involved in cell wall biosynthesis
VKTTLIVCTLNEITGMKMIMPQIDRKWVDQIIILDGGSTDGTVEYAHENGLFVYGQKEPGLHNAYTEVLPLVEGDIIITFSPDGNSIPELIPRLVEEMAEGYDMVIASRYLDGARSADDSWLTGFGNWLFTHTINLLFGARYTDAMVIYRAYKKQMLYDLEIHLGKTYELPERLFRTKIGCEPIISARAARRRLRITEIPGDEPPRIGGEPKLQVWRWGAAYLFQIGRDFLFWR